MLVRSNLSLKRTCQTVAHPLSVALGVARFGDRFRECSRAPHRGFLRQAVDDFSDHTWAFVDERRVNLYQIGTGDELVPCIVSGFDAADADNGDSSLQVTVEFSDHAG